MKYFSSLLSFQRPCVSLYNMNLKLSSQLFSGLAQIVSITATSLIFYATLHLNI